MTTDTLEKPTASKGLIAIEKLTPALLFAPDGVKTILTKIETEVRSVHTDISTKAGRDALASTAYKVSRSKTVMDDMGKALVADWKAKAKAVDDDRKIIRDRLDALRDEVRKPLTDHEEAEKARIEAHEIAIDDILKLVIFDDDEPTAEEISGRILQLNGMEPRDWQEFDQRGTAAIGSAENRLSSMLATAEKREADRAELDRLRALTADRERKDREDQIAKDATAKVLAQAEADKAKADADRIAAAAQAKLDQQKAIDDERQQIADAKEADDAAIAKRAANKRHTAKINNEVLAALVACGVEVEPAKGIIGAIVRGEIPHTTISY